MAKTRTRRLKIHVARCEESGVLIIQKSSIPGLHLEADTMDEMVREIKTIAPILIDTNMELSSDTRVFVEILLNQPTGVKNQKSRPAAQPRFLVEQDSIVA